MIPRFEFYLMNLSTWSSFFYPSCSDRSMIFYSSMTELLMYGNELLKMYNKDPIPDLYLTFLFFDSIWFEYSVILCTLVRYTIGKL